MDGLLMRVGDNSEISHFEGLSVRPTCLNFAIMFFRSSKTRGRGPAMVPSSRNHMLSSLLRLLMIGSIPTAKSREPKGSPCWTPVSDRID